MKVNDNLKKYNWLSCNESYSNKIDEKFKKYIKSTFKFSNSDIKKIILINFNFYWDLGYWDFYWVMHEWEKLCETHCLK